MYRIAVCICFSCNIPLTEEMNLALCDIIKRYLPFAKTWGEFGEEAHATRMGGVAGGTAGARVFQRRVVPCSGLT